MCTPELKLLYEKWDNSSNNFNMPLVRLPHDHSLAYICMDWNGSIIDHFLFQTTTNNQTLIDWSNEIYASFASYIGSCYKNCTWNNCQSLRDSRGYIAKPKTARFLTAWNLISLQPVAPLLTTQTL